MMQSKFLDLIENTEVFKYMLAGFFKDWEGTYDVLMADTGEYLFYPENKENFKTFCQKVRETKTGNELCLQCDKRHAALAAKKGKPLSYICDMGLVDIAIPIIVDEELVATIFCGQSRSEDPNDEELGRLASSEMEKEIGIPDGTLSILRDKIEPISQERIDKVIEKIWKMATYLSNMGLEKKNLSLKLEELTKIRKALDTTIGGVFENLEKFWQSISRALQKLNKIFGVTQSLLVMREIDIANDSEKLVIRACAGFTNGQENDLEFDNEILRTIKDSEVREATDIIRRGIGSKEITHVAIIPVQLDKDYSGNIIFFSDGKVDRLSSLPIYEEINLLSNISGRMATAYENCRLLSLRREWLKIFIHQLIAPLNGIVGHSENIFRWIDELDYPEETLETDFVPIEVTPKRLNHIISSAEEIIWMSKDVSGLARNFGWITEINKKRTLSLTIPQKSIVSLLIGYARSVQGFAHAKGIRTVHVDQESVKLLDGHIKINEELFTQAMRNILDNAVKYSDKRTEIIITASISNNFGNIFISNRGIRIREEDVENVFRQEYRTQEARARYAIGMGYGLTIARSIINLHNGKISVSPSITINEPDYIGFETTFKISLPIA
jgi:signal transduction histidine kinase